MVIHVSQLCFSYPDQSAVIKPCSFTLASSKMTAVLGANGSGKSTLLKLLSRDLPAQSGQIVIDDREIQNFSLEELALIRAVLPQQSEQHFAFPILVRELLLLACYKKAGAKRQHEDIILEISHFLELASLLNKNYQQLSGGEKQRVQVARVLVQIWPHAYQQQETKMNVYLLLDEPCSSLDMYHSHQLLNLLKQFCSSDMLKKKGIELSCFIVLHDINLALKYVDNILLMKSGELIAQGNIASVLTKENIQNTFLVAAGFHYDENNLLRFIETGL